MYGEGLECRGGGLFSLAAIAKATHGFARSGVWTPLSRMLRRAVNRVVTVGAWQMACRKSVASFLC